MASAVDAEQNCPSILLEFCVLLEEYVGSSLGSFEALIVQFEGDYDDSYEHSSAVVVDCAVELGFEQSLLNCCVDGNPHRHYQFHPFGWGNSGVFC